MAGDADVASHLSEIFDVRLSSESGYVYAPIPQFLVDRPRHLVNHCMKRLDAAQSIPANDITVVDSLLGKFKVNSQMEQNVVYSIKFADQSSMPNCNYPD